jgi:phage terminase large subunit-like protein
VHEHPDRGIIETLERGFKWRRQPLLIMITNAGSDRNSVCWEEHQHAVRVAAGTRTPDDGYTFVGEVIDDETFSFVCGLDKDDDPLEDPDCWPKANPLLGVTVQRYYLASVVRQARAIPGRLNGILRLHFCRWTDVEQAWMARATLAEQVLELDVECLLYDRYAYAKFEDELDELGVTIEQLEHPQGGVRRAKESGLWMPGSVDALETLILEGRIRLRRSPVLISAMMSAAVERDAFDNRRFSKRRAVNRIDALVALTMAAGKAVAGADPGSVYEERGLLVI